MGELPACLLVRTMYSMYYSLSGSEGKKLSKGTEFQFFLTLVFLLGFPVTLTTADTHSVEKENYKSKVVRRKEEDRAVRKGRRVDDGEEMDITEEEEKEEDGLSLDRVMTSIDDHDSEEEEEEDGKVKEVELDWDMLLTRVLSQYTTCKINVIYELIIPGEEGKKELGDQRRFSDPVLKILANCLHLLKTYVVYEVFYICIYSKELCHSSYDL